MSWIQTILSGVSGWFGNAYDAVRNWVTHLVHSVAVFLSHLFHLVGGEWANLAAEMRAFAHAARHGIVAAYAATLHLIRVDIPHWVVTYARWVKDWAAAELHTAAAALSAATAAVARWVSEHLHAVEVWAGNAVDWLHGELAGLSHTLGTVARRVSDLLGHPDRLVAWFLPYLWAPLFGYVHDHAEAIGRWALRRAVATTVGLAHEVEYLLARIL